MLHIVKISQQKMDALNAIHASASALHRVGAIDKAAMREFDESCLAAPPLEIAPNEIKRIRERAHVSQPVFARYLNTSESTVQKWEAGTKRPCGINAAQLALSGFFLMG
jgi:putative transcriptional regulator